MGDIVKLITELGSFGILLGLAGWIVYNHFKNSSEHQKIINVKSEVKEVINESIGDLKTSIKTISDRVTGLEKHIDDLTPMKTQETAVVKPSHPKQFLDRLKLGPQLHKTLNTFRTRINADHIFIGSFHNGNESITGIPYYKFDIIAERFRPDKVERDIEFAFMYKDADLLRHDLLPSEVVQRGVVHYVIEEDGKSVLADIDDIIYRRMVGRNIKQLAISLLRDPNGTPSGFVGCVRYDYEEIDLHELKDCGIELENVYAINEKLIISKNNN
jgi:hypothetical protein